MKKARRWKKIEQVDNATKFEALKDLYCKTPDVDTKKEISPSLEPRIKEIRYFKPTVEVRKPK